MLLLVGHIVTVQFAGLLPEYFQRVMTPWWRLFHLTVYLSMYLPLVILPVHKETMSYHAATGRPMLWHSSTSEKST